ncbi:MAG: hypothetical protein AABX47_01745 [Nanoarchaeota archaeon]
MSEIEPIVDKVKESFRLVKVDVNSLWYAHENVNKRCDYLQKRIADLEETVYALKGARPPTPKLVGSKLSNKVHEDRCVFARNIERENLVQFPSAKDAFSQGFHKCVCLA